MNDKVVKIIEDLLERAKKGEIVAVAIATIMPDLSTGSAYTLGDSTIAELLGAISIMNYRIISQGYIKALD